MENVEEGGIVRGVVILQKREDEVQRPIRKNIFEVLASQSLDDVRRESADADEVEQIWNLVPRRVPTSVLISAREVLSEGQRHESGKMSCRELCPGMKKK